MDKKYLWKLAETAAKHLNYVQNRINRRNGTVVCYDPSLHTENLGDEIIMASCRAVLSGLFPADSFHNISTHCLPVEEDKKAAGEAKYAFVCGTNLLTSRIEHHWRWVLPEGLRGKWPYRNVVLLGAGWGEYQDRCSDYSRMVYRCMLNPGVSHSVRDRYTLEKLREAGISNVIHTGCPTTWGLTPEFCRGIPGKKAINAVTTLTDYRRDPLRDEELLNILGSHYENLYFWPQGCGDEGYLNTLKRPENLRILPRKLSSYEEVLKPGAVDYVGTRLHGGIHALNHGVRSIIIAVDNRAAEMGRDLNLPVLPRERAGQELEKRICSEFPTEIRIPQGEIQRFLRQFSRKREKP